VINVNIENLLESVSEGLWAIGCEKDKKRLIIGVLMDIEVMALLRKKLSEHEAALKASLKQEALAKGEAIQQDLAFTKRLDKLEEEHGLTIEHKPLVFDVSYPKSIKPTDLDNE